MSNATSTDAGQVAEYTAQVRRLLRQREYRRALELLDRRLAGVAVTPSGVPVEDIRTYAYELQVRHGPGPSWRTPVSLRRGGPRVSLRRNVPVDLRRLDRPALERVLRWLHAGELRVAEEALRARDYPTVVTAAEHAAQIDDRGTRIAMAHARALYEIAVAELNTDGGNLDAVTGQLQRAARLAHRAGADPTLGEAPKKLSATVDEVSVLAEQRRSRAARVEALRSVARRYERLVEHYSDKDQLISHIQLGNARSSLAQIRGDVERLSQQHEPDSPAGRLLADLRVKCDRYKEQLERVGRRIRAE